MKIQKQHPWSGEINELDLDITTEQYERFLSGELIQVVMPNLSDDEREFMISGLLPGEYDELFNKAFKT